MRRPVLANLEELDPVTRHAAEAAARRAGLRLEDWVGEILADRLARQAPSAERRTSADNLDAIIDRMAQVARRPAKDETDAPARPASAVESLARWIAMAEERLDDSVRHSADSQNRMASAMSDALSALKDRLDAVERRERAPARIAFPVEEAAKVLSPLADTLLGLRTDVSRLAERLDQPSAAPWVPAVDSIGSQIEDLKVALAALATRDELEALNGSLQGLSRDLDKRPSGTAVLTLAGSIATLHGQVADLSDELRHGVHVRIGAEIEGIERKIDRLAESGVDRSVIDFLSSQIVDMRHDLANRAEPRQIERLSIEVAALTTQIAELRSTQVGRADFASLRTALEKVCGALADSVARQEANDVPDQIRGLGDKLDALARRPEREPANLEPIAAQLTLLTERMASATERRFEENETVQAQFDRLSSQIGQALEASSVQVPLWERFEALETDLRQIGERADTSRVELLVRALHDKLQATASPPSLKALQDEAAAIAEQAAKAAIREIRPGSDIASGEVAALKHGFAELKSLQNRADSKTHQTLRAVHEALEVLVARFADQDLAARAPILAKSHDRQQPADRLEAAVRRLHAAALSQIEEVSATSGNSGSAPAQGGVSPEQRRVLTSISGQEPDLGNVRASFIAAARRASQPNTASEAEPQAPDELAASPKGGAETAPSDAHPLSTPSLIERIRKTFEGQRRPLLFSVALLGLVTGTVAIRSHASISGTVAPVADIAPEAVRPTTDQSASLIQAPSLPATAIPVDAAAFADLPRAIPDALRRAASTGNPIALYEMANRLDRPHDRADAAQLFERAAQAGLAPAQQRVGAIYEQGLGVERDLPRAIGWYERAAQGGNVQAMHRLATLLASRGDPDYAAAFRWYTEAAEGGLRDSQFNLGVLLTRGLGTPRNLPRAYQWFDVAARQGDAEAADKRDEIAKRLAPPALAAAKLLSERWRARPIDRAANEVEWSGDERTAGIEPPLAGKT
ncbi:tetratricopeptide repeat protein [Microvirga brassicacearum]|uniref:Sel1 repeat family protein n=1 Tax=Microvirga brassicacearum TaxID=2580413 RepID=A0A5N3P8B9_9HYPH|nr:tetratricopeptide repeat protein [Microvirga brassicacearum]KAB0265984.1 hypothetical protein FEZ63_16275 [Microvirga brassicacearum]